MRHLFIKVLIALLYTTSLMAEERPPRPEPGSVVGKVIDANNGTAIEYANISIFSSKDSSLVTGGVSSQDGRFMISGLTAGQYYITAQFIGYHTITRDGIQMDNNMSPYRIGLVKLESKAQNLNEINIEADKQVIEFKIDKKVINPSQDLVAQGGSAVDILSNTPSVSVDIEGNVTMRGSSNFIVLMNGKPTPFEASDALAQVPASSIENIEVVTNPSVKHDPDGEAGIINIITKEAATQGWNGVANFSASTIGSYGGNALFNFTGNKTRWYVGANRRDQLRLADYYSNSGTINTETSDTSHISQTGERSMNFISNSLKTGFSYDLNKKNTLGIEISGGEKKRIFDSELNNYEWSTGESKTLSYADALTESSGLFGSISLNQKSQIGDNKQHTIESSIFYQFHDETGHTFSDKSNTLDSLLSSQETWDESQMHDIRIKSDYTLPLEHGLFETGYQLRMNLRPSSYDAAFDTVTDNSIFHSESDFSRYINSLYATFSSEQGRIGYKLGLRAEHTYRSLKTMDESLDNTLSQLDWYPSAHFSYNINKSQSLMASYSRRIQRPRGHWLDPYVMWRDPNNVRQGNPALSPEHINSYELSYQLRLGENTLSAEVYHRKVENKVERIRNSYDDGVLLTTFENIGADYSTGLELMLISNITPWWKLNTSVSLFDYRLDVTDAFINDISTTQSNNWDARISNTFKLSPSLRIQFDGMYHSPSITATGTRSSMLFTNLAIKKSFFDRKLDVGFTVKDVFDTAKHDVTTNGDTYYSNFGFDMRSPVFQLSISYLFNNYRPDRKGMSGEEGMSMEY